MSAARRAETPRRSLKDDLPIRLYRMGKDEDGSELYGFFGEDYHLSDFGGIAPAVGDHIVSPIFDAKDEWAVPIEDRDIHEVVGRYHRPGERPFMIVLVKTRKCQKEERRLVLGLN